MFELVAYWKDFPPAHVTLAGIVKSFGGESTTTTAPPSKLKDVQAFVGQFKTA